MRDRGVSPRGHRALGRLRKVVGRLRMVVCGTDIEACASLSLSTELRAAEEEARREKMRERRNLKKLWKKSCITSRSSSVVFLLAAHLVLQRNPQLVVDMTYKRWWLKKQTNV